jgi:hypothetical protein
MEYNYYGIIGCTDITQNNILLDTTNRILHIKLEPDFEKSTKLSRIEYWIFKRVLNRLTNS